MYGVFVLAASAGTGLTVFDTNARAAQSAKPAGSTQVGGPRSFEIVPLERVSETTSNASIGDINGDGYPDIVLVKGRHWQVPTLTFLGDGKGHYSGAGASE